MNEKRKRFIKAFLKAAGWEEDQYEIEHWEDGRIYIFLPDEDPYLGGHLTFRTDFTIEGVDLEGD